MAAYSSASTNSFQFQRIVLAIQIGMIVLISILFLNLGKLPGLDLVCLALLTLFLWWARERLYLLNFAPFLLLAMTYECIRGLVLVFGMAGLHVTDIIIWEKTLSGGIIPSYTMQRALSGQPYTWFVDIVANGFYMTHFFSVMAVGLLLWYSHREHYWPYVLGLIVLSYSAFLTYVFFPAAPPWWASMYGYLKGQAVNLSHSLLSPEYIIATGNPTAAMPSLHTAWPFYLFFYCVFLWRKKALLVIILPLGVALSSVYLGHHYLIDVLAGVVYAVVAFVCTAWWSRNRIKLNPQEQKSVLATV